MGDVSNDDLLQKVDELLPAVKQVNEQFQDPVSHILPVSVGCYH